MELFVLLRRTQGIAAIAITTFIDYINALTKDIATLPGCMLAGRFVYADNLVFQNIAVNQHGLSNEIKQNNMFLCF